MPYIITGKAPSLLKYFLVVVALIALASIALQVTLSVTVINKDKVKQHMGEQALIHPRSEQNLLEKYNIFGGDTQTGNAGDYRISIATEDEKETGVTGNELPLSKPNMQKQNPDTDKQNDVSEENNHNQILEEIIQKQLKERNSQKRTDDQKPIPKAAIKKQFSEKNEHKQTDEQNQPVVTNKENPPAKAATSNTNTTETGNKTKYLFYLCDIKKYCYGLGDRQRAVASVYYLAEITNRRFGLIMTSPADLREFYEPNLVNWDIPSSELPVNATVKELVVYGPDNILRLNEVDFNVEHPEDIIYMRTNQELWHSMLKNPVYRDRIPKWARVHKSKIIPLSWLRLMRPTALLRTSLNYALMDIAEKIQEEDDIRKRLDGSGCCQKRSPQNLTVCDGVNVTVYNGSSMTTQESCFEYNVASFKCYTFGNKCPYVDSSKCFAQLSSNLDGSKNASDVEDSAQNYCTNTRSISTFNGSIDSLAELTGFDVTNMNLVCAHIRLGDWMAFQGRKLKLGHHKYLSVWNFLQNFAKKGHHIFIASDSHEWKEIARAFFGQRMHTLEQGIRHVALDRSGDKARDGMLFALTEQLFLGTNCQELLISESGFSIRPAQIRPYLMKANTVWKLLSKKSFRIYQ